MSGDRRRRDPQRFGRLAMTPAAGVHEPYRRRLHPRQTSERRSKAGLDVWNRIITAPDKKPLPPSSVLRPADPEQVADRMLHSQHPVVVLPPARQRLIHRIGDVSTMHVAGHSSTKARTCPHSELLEISHRCHLSASTTHRGVTRATRHRRDSQIHGPRPAPKLHPLRLCADRVVPEMAIPRSGPTTRHSSALLPLATTFSFRWEAVDFGG